MEKTLKRRGGVRTGAGRPKEEDTVRIRIKKSIHQRWQHAKVLGKHTDNSLAEYLLDLAESTDTLVSSGTPVTSSPKKGRPVSSSTSQRGPAPLFDVPELSTIVANPSDSTDKPLSITMPTLLGDIYTSSSSSDDSGSSSGSDDDDDLDSTDHLNVAMLSLLDSGSEHSDHEQEKRLPVYESDSDTNTETEYLASISGTPSMVDTIFFGVKGNDCTGIDKFSATCPPALMIADDKVIVSVPQLLQLIPDTCYMKNCMSPLSSSLRYKGCAVVITLACTSGHEYSWSSSPELKNAVGYAIHANNLLFASGLLCSGNAYAKVKKMMDFMGVKCISESTYYRYQSLFILPTIECFWDDHLADIQMKLSGKPLVISGDGRCDSPGSSAKFCTYTLMDSDSNLIVDSETVTKQEVQYKSPNMERLGVLRSLKRACQKVNIAEVVTDASTSVMATLANEFPAIHHSLDIWHKAKKIRKSLLEASKSKGMGKLALWADHIVNHFWYCCESCNDQVENLKTNWISLLHHVCDVHEWATGECQHEPLTGPPKDRDGTAIPYFDPTEKDFSVLQKIVLDEKWLKSLQHYTRFRHTGMLESYHNMMLVYAPKRTGYEIDSYKCRIMLAGLDHNMHISRATKEPNEDALYYHRVWRKRTKRWDVIPVKVDKHYNYIPELMQKILSRHTASTRSIRSLKRKQRATTTTRDVPRQTKEIVDTKKSRFSV